tara:strand:- start:5154 stop:6752 length:1599 start_codon:yes stop_codon:yes gene_type:complete
MSETNTLPLPELLHEREWRKCAPSWDESSVEQLADAFEYWCAQYVYIRFPGKGKIKFQLRPAQRETIELWLGNRHTVALKARQIGFSTLVSIFAFWCAFFWSDRTIIMLSKTERDSQKLLVHARYASRFLPTWMLHRGPLFDANKSEIKFTNESHIESLPSASDPARGTTVFYIIVDEVGQLPNSDEAWAAIEPVTDIGGSLIMLGTANGEGNLLHKIFTAAQAGNNQFKSIFHSWRAAGRDDAWYAEKKRNLPDWQLAQEYPDNPEEAFLRSGRPVFDLDFLRAAATREPVRGWLDEDTSGEFKEDKFGPLRVWEAPVVGHRYCMGVDVAEGLEYGDFSSVHVKDVNSNEIVAHWHGHIDPDLLGTDVCIPLGKFYNQALILVESNNHGLTTLTALNRNKYFPLYRERRVGKRSDGITDSLGWRTTSVTKRLAVDELNKAVRDGELVLYDSDTIAEMRTFVRDMNGRMHGSPHDDRVMSLAICQQGIKYVHLRQYKPESPIVVGSMKWHRHQMGVKDEETPKNDFVGSDSW